MAKAKVKTKQPKQVVVLTLSFEEAQTLRVVMAKISGDPTGSPRKHTQSVNDALHGVVGDYRRQPQYGVSSGSIHFDDGL